MPSTPRGSSIAPIRRGTIDGNEALRQLRTYVRIRLAALRHYERSFWPKSGEIAIVRDALQANVRSVAASLGPEFNLVDQINAFADDLPALWKEARPFEAIEERHRQIDPYDIGATAPHSPMIRPKKSLLRMVRG